MLSTLTRFGIISLVVAALSGGQVALADYPFRSAFPIPVPAPKPDPTLLEAAERCDLDDIGARRSAGRDIFERDSFGRSFLRVWADNRCKDESGQIAEYVATFLEADELFSDDVVPVLALGVGSGLSKKIIDELILPPREVLFGLMDRVAERSQWWSRHEEFFKNHDSTLEAIFSYPLQLGQPLKPVAPGEYSSSLLKDILSRCSGRTLEEYKLNHFDPHFMCGPLVPLLVEQIQERGMKPSWYDLEMLFDREDPVFKQTVVYPRELFTAAAIDWDQRVLKVCRGDECPPARHLGAVIYEAFKRGEDELALQLLKRLKTFKFEPPSWFEGKILRSTLRDLRRIEIEYLIGRAEDKKLTVAVQALKRIKL